MSNQSYISSIAADAQQAVAGTGLFASVMIAQAAEESGYGKSPLASKYNNHFGIKASGSWSGGKVAMDTTEYVRNIPHKEKDLFRTYSSTAEGFADRVKFLKANSRYKKGGVFSATTPEAEAKALQSAGYATDPAYATKLISIINQYGLKKYDGATSAPDNTGVSQDNAIEPGKKVLKITAGMIVAVLAGLLLYNLIMKTR